MVLVVWLSFLGFGGFCGVLFFLEFFYYLPTFFSCDSDDCRVRNLGKDPIKASWGKSDDRC